MQPTLSRSKRRWLLDQLERWRSQGIVTTEQSQQILAQYQSPEVAAAVTWQRAINVLVGVAALLVLAGTLLIISFNWEAMPTWAKLLLILTMVVGMHLLAFRLRQRGETHWFTLCQFLGGAFYGCGIMLIGQVFHLGGHTSSALWWWALGIFPMVICQQSLLLHALFVGLLASWSLAQFTEQTYRGLAELPVNSQPLIGACSMALLTGPALLLAYRQNRAGLLWLYVPLLAWWASLHCLLPWVAGPLDDSRVLFLVAGLGGMLVIIAEAHPPHSTLAVPWRAWGVLTAGTILVPLSIRQSEHEFHGSDFRLFHHPVLAARVQLTAMIMLGLLLVVLLAIARTQGPWATWSKLLRSLQVMLRRECFPGGFTLLMAALVLGNDSPTGSLAAMVLTNLVMLALAIWLMLLGVREERALLFVAGLLYLLLWTSLRYIDLFGPDLGMLGGAIFFFPHTQQHQPDRQRQHHQVRQHHRSERSRW
ncbi:MAG: DUF2157 domain-containing protein [Planctomycetaceae bacterium]